MNSTAQRKRVHAQRQHTVAAIRQAQAWAKTYRADHPGAISDFVDMYIGSTNCTTVVELAELEGQVRTHLQQLQRQQSSREVASPLNPYGLGV